MKDSSVDAVCHGAKVMIPGILRFENGIEVDEVVVIITTKGEAIALGIALMTTEQMYNSDHGFAAKIKRVIMDGSIYPKCCGKGTVAQEKKRRIKACLITQREVEAKRENSCKLGNELPQRETESMILIKKIFKLKIRFSNFKFKFC